MAESKVSPLPNMNKKTPQSQIQRLKKLEEDEHWISEEELYTEGSSDEEKGTHSSRRRRERDTRRSHATSSSSSRSEKSHSPAPEFKPLEEDITGMNYEEITKSEKTLSEMKQKIRKLKKTLRDPNAICELYDINQVREELRKKHEPVKRVASHESLEAGFAEMQKLDEVLKKKSEEEKAAKLSRMQEEEESRDILTDLLSEEVSECIRNNSEQFLRLVNGWEQISSGGSLESLSNSTDGQAAPAPIKKERPIKRRRRPGAFIERNIQLAKCGNGVLSLTDEEKIRIENLLKEPDSKTANDTIVLDDSSLSNGGVDLNSSFSSSICSENLYVLSDEAKELLEQIDQKLKEFSKLKVPETIPKFKSAPQSESNSDTKETESSKDEHEEQEQGKCVKKKDNKKRMTKKKFFPLKDEAYRLKEVDKLLGLMNSVYNDEISPLSEEDIHILVEKVRLSLDVLPPGSSTDRTEATETTTTENESQSETQSSVISMPMPSPETMLELVDAAKSQMPNFKYRYTCS